MATTTRVAERSAGTPPPPAEPSTPPARLPIPAIVRRTEDLPTGEWPMRAYVPAVAA